jgi:hypothetical protein
MRFQFVELVADLVAIEDLGFRIYVCGIVAGLVAGLELLVLVLFTKLC